MWFVQTIWTLVWVSAGTGVFTGIRGGLFTLSSARLNLRLRRQLFAALMSLDMGFFDATPTGDISSRLASDTNSASDQISLCMNVAMRSSMQALLVLMFMLYASWRLTTITFILIPLIMAISKIYGNYYSIMIKKTRTELAEANAVAEQVLGTMSTVKAHAAQASSQAFYSQKLDAYFTLSCSTSVAYALYAAVNTFLPNAVSALVLFYGGSLVLQGHMSPGALVSFMLYQQSLSSAFQAMSDVFSGLMAAVGAADKVLELIHRQPAVSDKGTLVPAGGLQGRIELRDIVFHYPTRPDAPVLRGLTFLAAPGEVIALVGPSGGGKSSIVKLVERFYLPASGQTNANSC
ncbi:hypothetical protein FOA52_013397 [Chlamydomonas sp. UWO 241]|nr:hypothetical protein FOA52_013397 [Chlamydomonas sp. UWO 241]